jgi:hypothetical protein
MPYASTKMEATGIQYNTIKYNEDIWRSGGIAPPF